MWNLRRNRNNKFLSAVTDMDRCYRKKINCINTYLYLVQVSWLNLTRQLIFLKGAWNVTFGLLRLEAAIQNWKLNICFPCLLKMQSHFGVRSNLLIYMVPESIPLLWHYFLHVHFLCLNYKTTVICYLSFLLTWNILLFIDIVLAFLNLWQTCPLMYNLTNIKSNLLFVQLSPICHSFQNRFLFNIFDS